MQPNEVTVTAWGFAERLVSDEYSSAWEANPAVLELASNQLGVTEFRDLRTLEEATTALQNSRGGKLGMRHYKTTNIPFSDVHQIMLKPYKPARPAYVPGTLTQKVLSRTAPQGRLWIEKLRFLYPQEQEPAFTAIYQAIERAITARSSQPKSLPLSYGPGVPRRSEAQTPSDAPPQTSANTSAPDTSTPDVSDPDTSAPDVSGPDTSAPDVSDPDTSAPDVSGSCPHCGQPTAPDANFCPACGGQIKTLCPSCQHQIKAGDNFCPNCGERVTPALAN